MIKATPTKRTPEDLKQIALDLYAGKIFTDRHLDRPEDAPMVFMPIAFMDEKQREEIIKMKPAMIFEYMDKSLPRSVNGYPIFGSFQMLSRKETKTVTKMYKEIKEAVDKVPATESKQVGGEGGKSVIPSGNMSALAGKKKRRKKNVN